MGCCSSALEDAKEAIEETLLQQKVNGIEQLDTSILDIKQGCKELKDCIDPIKKRYDLYSHTEKDVIHGRMSEEQLQLPSLSVWARESTFVGSADAAAKIQHISGHQFELATLEKAVRHTEVRECVKLLAQAEEILMSATKICSTYMLAESKLDARKKKLEAARKKKLDADEASKAADAALEVAKAATVAANGEFTPADAAVEEAKSVKAAAAEKKAGEDNSSAEAKAEAERAYASACDELQEAMDTFYEAQQKRKKAVEAEARADSVATDRLKKKQAADEAEAKAAAACAAAEEEVAQAKAVASSEGPLKRNEAEQKVKAAFNALQSGYERFRFGAEGYAANPDKYEAEFARYEPKASEGALEGITELLASAMKEGLAAAKLDKEPPAAPASEEGASAFGAQAEKVKALKTGCESAARRTVSAAKQIKAWSKVGLRSILGPKSHAKLSEEQMVGELVKLLLADDVKEAVANLALPGKDVMEEDFAAGACVAIQDATADLKSKMDAISKEASDWANKLEKAEDARAKIKAKATAAKADEDAGKPEERRRKPADDIEVSISKMLDDRVQKDFETLMAKAAVLAGSGEGSVEAIYLTPLKDFMAAQTQFLMARKVVGAFVVPEGLVGLTHESIEAHAPVVQDEQQVLSDAATEPEAAPRPSFVRALSKVKSMRSGRLPMDASTSSLVGGSAEDRLEALSKQFFMALSKKAKRTSAKDLLTLQPERATAYLVDDIEDDPALAEELNEGDAAAAAAADDLPTGDAAAPAPAPAPALGPDLTAVRLGQSRLGDDPTLAADEPEPDSNLWQRARLMLGTIS